VAKAIFAASYSFKEHRGVNYREFWLPVDGQPHAQGDDRLMRKLAAELVGTFILVFAGTGAIVINDASPARSRTSASP
jgi:hypothetical protein